MKKIGVVVNTSPRKVVSIEIRAKLFGKGDKGDDGLSAYEVAVANGFTGTELERLELLQGTDGREIEIRNSGTTIQRRYVGDVDREDIVSLNALKGDKGDKGDTGFGIADGGTTGQILAKKSNDNYDTERVNDSSFISAIIFG